jgi:hypothetical protein
MAADETDSALGVASNAPAEAEAPRAPVARAATLGANPIGDTVDLVKRYFLQETVQPLSRIGRTVAYGLGGALLLAIGLTLALVAFLRLLQQETGTTFAGNWSWVPYALTAFLAIGLIAILVLVASRGLRRDTAGTAGT